MDTAQRERENRNAKAASESSSSFKMTITVLRFKRFINQEKHSKTTSVEKKDVY